MGRLSFGVLTLLAVACLCSSTAHSQMGGYTVMTPGQPPSVVTPNPSPFGGYTVATPGQPKTIVTPNALGGGYTVATPGQPKTIISPNSYGDPGDNNPGSYSGPAPGTPSYGR